MSQLHRCFVVLTLITALLAPKLSALALHVMPGAISAVICTGSELVTIQIDANGNPVEVTETDHGACLLANPDTLGWDRLAGWWAAPKSFHKAFAVHPVTFLSNAESGLIADQRGPPQMV